jgi:DNA-binding transcriptional LysR family regulator
VEIRDLRYFLVLAEELHFGRASARLHIVQPALSQQLKRLERELGVVLVERSSRQVSLTPAGERLRREAAEVTRRFDRVEAVMARLRDGVDGRLVLGISPGIRPELLQSLVLAVTRTAGAEVTTTAANSAEAAHLLEQHRVDAALVHGRIAERDIAHRVIDVVPLGVAVPSSHRLARRRAVRARDLTGETLIWIGRDVEPQLFDSVMGRLTAAGYEPGPTQHPPTVDTSLNLVAAGIGVSLKFRHELRQAPRVGVAWRPFADVELEVPTVLTWRRGDRSPLLSKLRHAAGTSAAPDAR